MLLAWSLLFACQQQEKAETLYFNATIYTVDSTFSTVEAMAIREGKVVATGSFDELDKQYVFEQKVDLEGQFVYPGFNDAHSHFMGYAQSIKAANLYGTHSWEEVLTRVQDFHTKEQGDVIFGRGWDQNHWDVKEFPTRNELDSLFPNTPVALVRIDGHAWLVNGAALALSGINGESEIRGGIVKMENGEPTGLLIDNAISLLDWPKMPVAQMADLLQQAEQNLFAAGLTTVCDAGLERYQIEMLDSLHKAEALKIRVYAMVADEEHLMEYYLKVGPLYTDKLNVRAFKFYLDGALGSRGALMLAPYADDSNNVGLQLNSYQHYLEAAKKLEAAGWQMCAHAIGDSANRLVLDVYSEVLKDKDSRWRVEHAQIVHPKDVLRFGELGVIPSIQPTHATSDMAWAYERLGAERMNEAYPYKSLKKSAGVLALGTDFPVERISPILTFYSAVFRMDGDGNPPGGFGPDEMLTREEVLRGMTIDAAYAEFEEHRKGSLEAGKLADFVVLDTDLLSAERQKIRNTNVLATYLNGDLVFKAE